MASCTMRQVSGPSHRRVAQAALGDLVGLAARRKRPLREELLERPYEGLPLPKCPVFAPSYRQLCIRA